MRLAPLILISALIFAFSCDLENSLPTYKPKLSSHDLTICNQFGLDTSLVKNIRRYNTEKFEAFRYSLGKMSFDNTIVDTNPIFMDGIMFQHIHETSDVFILELKDLFRTNGYTLFLLENHFGINDQMDVIALINGTDKLQILNKLQTNGLNYDIDTDSLLTIIAGLDKRLKLELIGAGGDWCEFIIHKNPPNWQLLAEEIYAICPDVVDQGVGSISELSRSLQLTGRLYFWWD